MKQNPALKVFALLAVSVGLLPVNAGALADGCAAEAQPSDRHCRGLHGGWRTGGRPAGRSAAKATPDHAEWQGQALSSC